MKLFNLNLGVKIDNSEEVVETIYADKYDIVTFQESMRKLSGNVKSAFNSCNVLKERLALKNNFFAPLWFASKIISNGIIEIDFDGFVEQGNQVLTNYPIISNRNIFYHKNYSCFEDVSNFKQDDHPRAFAEVILNIDGKYLQIINVHGIWNKGKVGDERTNNQTNCLLNCVRDDMPCIVVGDFNLLPNSHDILKIDNHLINLAKKYNIKSTRSNSEDKVCDYIFVNEKVKVNKFYALNSIISDHLPLILEFDI